MKNSTLFLWFIFFVVIGACAPMTASPSPQVETPVLTEKPLYSETVSPTPTPLPTEAPTLTPTVSPTIYPTATSTLTSTPVPPLVAHKWQAETALVRFEYAGGDSWQCCQFPYPPELILYADGRLITTHHYQVGDEWKTELLVKQLNRQQVCAFLNTVDQIGFLDYDPSTYEPQSELRSDGGSHQKITVNSWKRITGEFYDLGWYLSWEGYLGYKPEDDVHPTVRPALRDMFWLLRSYFPKETISLDMKLYRPERLGILAAPLKEAPYVLRSRPIETWPFPDVNLAEIYKTTTVTIATNATPSGYMTLTTKFYVINGKKAETVYKFLGSAYNYARLFRQDGALYSVFARPLLPYESPSAGDEPFNPPDSYYRYRMIPDPKLKLPSITLSCSPDDGVLPIVYPTPWK